MPSEPDAPDAAYEKTEVRERVRAAIRTLPARERKVIGLYYYGDVTMKQIGAEIGVNESRVSQLHARAMQRLRALMAGEAPAPKAATPKAAPRPRLAHTSPKRRQLKAVLPPRPAERLPETRVA